MMYRQVGVLYALVGSVTEAITALVVILLMANVSQPPLSPSQCKDIVPTLFT